MFLSVMLKTIADYLSRKQTMRELATLDDRQLADIGITRGQIRGAVTSSSFR